MKGRLTIAVLLLSLSLAKAQSFHYGVKADFNFTSVRGTGMDTQFGTGVEGGLFGDWNFSKNWSLQPELLLTQSNTKRSDDFMTYYVNSGKQNGNDAIKLTYLSVPVLVKYDINKWVSVLAGPQYNFMVFDNEDLLIDDKDAFKKGEISGNVGAQLNLSNVSIFGRYNFGLSDINNVDDRYSWHSAHIQVGVAVKIK